MARQFLLRKIVNYLHGGFLGIDPQMRYTKFSEGLANIRNAVEFLIERSQTSHNGGDFC
jgi:hypothetical protein